ncbi:MAG: Zn-ribbon domain-containing OB-fold protein [Gammaproteobacteria bacterium]
MRRAADGRPLAEPDPTSRPYFDALSAGRLLLPHCPRDGWFFYPRSRCPACLGADWQWREASGRGRVHAFTVDRLGHEPGLKARVPFVIALIELDEGPRLPSNVCGCAPEDVHIGMPVEAFVEMIDGAPVLAFRPVS